MSSDTSPIVIALNFAWSEIQRKHPEIPGVMIVTGRRRHKSESTIRGSHCAETWHVHEVEDRVAEVWVSGERLGEGGEQVMQTLIHEAAHALANKRGLKDTSNKNRYHNKTFVKLAEELGLEGPGSSAGPALGYSNCTITEVTAKSYESAIERLERACKNFVVPAQQDEAKARKESIKAVCQCDTEGGEITWTKKLQKRYEEIGIYPLECAICKQPFVPEGEEAAA